MPHLHEKKGGKLSNVSLTSLNNFLLKENIVCIPNYIFLFMLIFDVCFVVIVSNNNGSFIPCKWSFKNRLFSVFFFLFFFFLFLDKKEREKKKKKNEKKTNKKTTLTSRHLICYPKIFSGMVDQKVRSFSEIVGNITFEKKV